MKKRKSMKDCDRNLFGRVKVCAGVCHPAELVSFLGSMLSIANDLFVSHFKKRLLMRKKFLGFQFFQSKNKWFDLSGFVSIKSSIFKACNRMGRLSISIEMKVWLELWLEMMQSEKVTPTSPIKIAMKWLLIINSARHLLMISFHVCVCLMWSSLNLYIKPVC